MRYYKAGNGKKTQDARHRMQGGRCVVFNSPFEGGGGMYDLRTRNTDF